MVNIVPQVYLDECLYHLKMLESDRIDISEEIGVNKTNASKECDNVTIRILKTLVSSMDHIFSMAAIISC